jgi:Tfp pilus assembly protein PilV
MSHHRQGTSLCEMLVALTLLSATAAWGLAAAAAAERSVAAAQRRTLALHRAEAALSGVASLSCDSSTVTTYTVEPRWDIAAQRSTVGHVRQSVARVVTRTADSLTVSHSAWCD